MSNNSKVGDVMLWFNPLTLEPEQPDIFNLISHL